MVAVYLNTDEPADMNRYYPFIEKPWEVYPADLSMGDFNFFYLADGEHNPERKTVWTGVSGSGGTGLEVVVHCAGLSRRHAQGARRAGCDVPADGREHRESWSAVGRPACLLVAPDGRIPAATEQARRLTGLRELPAHVYSAPISEEKTDPEELKSASIADAALRGALERFLSSDESLGEVELSECTAAAGPGDGAVDRMAAARASNQAFGFAGGDRPALPDASPNCNPSWRRRRPSWPTRAGSSRWPAGICTMWATP